MIYLPISLDTIQVIIDDVFAVIRAQNEIEEECPEAALNAAWFKLYGIEKLFEEVDQFVDTKEKPVECHEIRDALSEAMLEIEALAELAMFKEREQQKMSMPRLPKRQTE